MQIERHIVFWIAALAAFAGLLWLLSPILLPFVLGMALAYVLDPLANRLAKRGLSRMVAASIILGGFVLALALLLLLIAPVLAKQLAGFIDNAPGYAQRLQSLVSDPNHPWLKRIVGDNLGGGDKSVGDLMNQAMGYLTNLLGSLWTKGQALISIFSLLIITPVVAFYSDLRLGPHGERGRQPDPAAAARHRAQPRPRHRCDHFGLCARTIRRVPDPRFLLCASG